MPDYDTNRIRKHEFTRPDKEDDRVRQIDALNAQTGPVLLAYPPRREVDKHAEARQRRDRTHVTADDGVRHTLWVMAIPRLIDRVHGAPSMPCLPSTSPTGITARRPPRGCARAGGAAPQHGGGSYNYFLRWSSRTTRCASSTTTGW